MIRLIICLLLLPSVGLSNDNVSTLTINDFSSLIIKTEESNKPKEIKPGVLDYIEFESDKERISDIREIRLLDGSTFKKEDVIGARVYADDSLMMKSTKGTSSKTGKVKIPQTDTIKPPGLEKGKSGGQDGGGGGP